MGALNGKGAIVTGGTRGIGRAIAERFAREGARVVVAGRGEQRETFVADNISFFRADISKADQVSKLVDFAITKLGRVDTVVNNAGVELEKTIDETSEQEWDWLMDINMKGVFLCAKHVIPHMREQGGGSIINLGSISGFVADRGLAAYNASKAGVLGLTRSIAVDHGEDGIRCNAICPGWIETDMLAQTFSAAPDPEAARAKARRKHPIGRLGHVDDIASTALWLASDEAGFVSGQTFTIDGGLTAQAQIDPAHD
ncbi:MAG: SDR family NAD(P)-dependent oxidoreductase [Gammaproteobacteria bacterium]